jgi:hypothetical protein
MSDISTVRGTIGTKRGPILVRDLSNFLTLYRSVYIEAVLVGRDQETESYLSEDEAKYFAGMVATRLAKQGAYGFLVESLVEDDEDLAIIDISRKNPIDIVFSGVVLALAAATIISGGKFRFDKDGIEVELPPLGKGIAALKRALMERDVRDAEIDDAEDDSSENDVTPS